MRDRIPGVKVSSLLRGLCAVALFTVVSVGMALAVGLVVKGYSTPLDALTAGGGAAATLSARQVEDAVGEEIPSGLHASEHYLEESGLAAIWADEEWRPHGAEWILY